MNLQELTNQSVLGTSIETQGGKEGMETLTVREQMESKMLFSWEEVSQFLSSVEGTGFSVDAAKKAWGDLWASNKAELFKLFGNEVRIEREVELSLSLNDVNQEVRSLLRNLKSDGSVSNIYLQVIALFFSSIPYEDIIENKLSENITIFKTKFNKGMKLSRAIGRLIKDNKQRDAFQTAYSMAIQGFKAVGTLVMSIDPIDILTMSYNPNDAWRSCHNIIDGEYRAGAVSYVCDKTTFISYVYKSKEMSCHLDKEGKELPNKIWRVIGYYNQDTIALSTHYPSTNKSNRQTLVNLIAEVTGKGDAVSGGMVDCDFTEYLEIRSGDFPFTNQGSDLHYNDITEGRLNRFYAIDLSGLAKEQNADSFEKRLAYAHEKTDFGRFYVGLPDGDVPGIGGGFIYDSGSITEYASRDDDDDYYDDEDDY